MTNIEVKVKKLTETAKLPNFAHTGDSCADLYADESILINPNQTVLVNTGISLEIPKNYEGQIRPRSGLALKHSLIVVNSPGTIDSGYRGEVKIIIRNLSSHEYKIEKGDRIAQLAVRPVPKIEFNEVEALEGSDRGEGGFGSTGKK